VTLLGEAAPGSFLGGSALRVTRSSPYLRSAGSDLGFHVQPAAKNPAGGGWLQDVQQAAALLNCRKRHIIGMNDAARIPPRARLGRLLRWRRNTLLQRPQESCPPVSSMKQRSQSVAR